MNEKTTNIQIVEFRQRINQLINSCGLDAGIVYYIMKDIFNEVEKQYNKISQQEYNQYIQQIQTNELKEIED